MPRKRSATAAGARAPVVAILMGSDSDLPTMQEAAKILEEVQILALSDVRLKAKLADHRARMAAEVAAKDRQVQPEPV